MILSKNEHIKMWTCPKMKLSKTWTYQNMILSKNHKLLQAPDWVYPLFARFFPQECEPEIIGRNLEIISIQFSFTCAFFITNDIHINSLLHSYQTIFISINWYGISFALTVQQYWCIAYGYMCVIGWHSSTVTTGSRGELGVAHETDIKALSS